MQVLGTFGFPKATLSSPINAAINIQIVSLKGKQCDCTKQGSTIPSSFEGLLVQISPLLLDNLCNFLRQSEKRSIVMTRIRMISGVQALFKNDKGWLFSKSRGTLTTPHDATGSRAFNNNLLFFPQNTTSYIPPSLPAIACMTKIHNLSSTLEILLDNHISKQ